LHRRAGLFELGSLRKLVLDDLLGDLFAYPGPPELTVDPTRSVPFAGLIARGTACELLIVEVAKLSKTSSYPAHRLPSIPGP